MKHYADNLGTNVAAMIKVRQVDYILLHFEGQVQGGVGSRMGSRVGNRVGSRVGKGKSAFRK